MRYRFTVDELEELTVFLSEAMEWVQNIVVSLKIMLEKNGFNVIGEAENGAVAVKKYQQLSSDFVTMDITMPEVDGI